MIDLSSNNQIKRKNKMAFTEISSLDCETTTALGGRNKEGKPNPTQVEGYYIGSKDVESRKSKTGKAKLHVLLTAKGNLGVWGKTDLDRKMLNVTPGVMVRITQNGKVPTPNGEMYKFKVEVDSENTTEVSVQNAGSESSEDSYSDSESYGETEMFDDEAAADEVQYVAPKAPAKGTATTPDAARQAKVRALLASKNKSA